MKSLAFLLFYLPTIIGFSQTNKTTTNKVITTAKPVQTKPTAAPINTNVVGSFFMNYEIKNGKEALKTGKVFYATDNNLVLISPSNSGLKDVSNLRMLIDTKESEMTMLTIDIKNKKNGLLTKLPKPLLNKTTSINKAPLITKTGIYKIIQGFKCEKTLINIGDSINIESYITTEIVVDIANVVALINSSLRNKSPLTKINYDTKGTALESIITKKNGDITKLVLSEIKKGKPDATIFSSNGYNIMDARGLPMFNNAQ